MTYITPEVEIEKFSALDVIASSSETPTSTVPQGNDPYTPDIW